MLKIENLHASVGDKKVLNGLSLEVKPGEDFGILGVVCGVFRPFVTMESQTAEMSKA